jgi:thioredoxin 1
MSAFSELINGDQPVLVDFYAEWCGPCKTMAPILSDVASKLAGKVKIIKVDIGRNPKAAAAYSVMAVPTLVLFRKGRMEWKQSGVVPARELEQLLLRYTQ